jgi:hypothetical protein
MRFHDGNTGPNPVGDANNLRKLASLFRASRNVQRNISFPIPITVVLEVRIAAL